MFHLAVLAFLNLDTVHMMKHINIMIMCVIKAKVSLKDNEFLLVWIVVSRHSATKILMNIDTRVGPRVGTTSLLGEDRTPINI